MIAWKLVDYDSAIELENGDRYYLREIPAPFKDIVLRALAQAEVSGTP